MDLGFRVSDICGSLCTSHSVLSFAERQYGAEMLAEKGTGGRAFRVYSPAVPAFLLPPRRPGWREMN